MKPINFINEHIYIGYSKKRGRGVFCKAAIKKNSLIEIAPVIVMPGKDRSLIDQTLLHDYIFEWDEHKQQCCMALGYVPLYNHSYTANCEYEMNFIKEIISIRTSQQIEAGEELFINYNGEWNNEKPLWFEAS